MRIRRARSQSAYLCIECKNLRGSILAPSCVLLGLWSDMVSPKRKSSTRWLAAVRYLTQVMSETGAFLGSKLDTKVVVSIAEEYIRCYLPTHLLCDSWY